MDEHVVKLMVASMLSGYFLHAMLDRPSAGRFAGLTAFSALAGWYSHWVLA